MLYFFYVTVYESLILCTNVLPYIGLNLTNNEIFEKKKTRNWKFNILKEYNKMKPAANN